MTVEELDIIVNANIEKAIKEFNKLLPTIKKQLSGMQKEFNKINIKDIKANVDITQVNKKIKDAKKEVKEVFNTENINIEITGLDSVKDKYKGLTAEQIKLHEEMEKVSNKMDNFKIGSEEYENLKQKLHELNREYQGLPPKINMPLVNKTNISSNGENIKNQNINNNKNIDVKPTNESLSIWDLLKQKILQIKPVIEQYKQSLNDKNSSKELELLKYNINEIEEKLEKAKNGEIHLKVKEGLKFEAELERLNKKKEKLEQQRKRKCFFKNVFRIKFYTT